ncbi:MAG: hypothetical protein AAF799_37170 [Myxococcota bacterium]
MKRVLIAGLLLLTACPGHAGRSIVIDLEQRTATIRWTLEGSDPGDYRTIVEDYVEGDALNKEHPGWTIDAKRLEPVGEELHGVAELSWKAAGDVGITRAARAGYALRFCPAAHEMVKAANAHARTPSGCVLWKEGVKVLRIETVTRDNEGRRSLLEWYEADETRV